jgi:hypothetical protein
MAYRYTPLPAFFAGVILAIPDNVMKTGGFRFVTRRADLAV